MWRAATTPVIAVEVLVKERVILELRPAGRRRRTQHRAASVSISQEQSAKAPCQLVRDVGKAEGLPRADRVFDAEIVAVIAVEAIQRLDQQEIDRHPDRPAPIGIAAEYPRPRLARLVTDAEPVAGMLEDERMLLVDLRHRAN